MTYTIEISDELDEFEWADMKDELVLAFEDLGDELLVEATNLGWTHGTGAGVTESHKAWGLLSINGDYRLVAEVDSDEIVVRRYSHDEPMGATFKFRKATEVEAV